MNLSLVLLEKNTYRASALPLDDSWAYPFDKRNKTCVLVFVADAVAAVVVVVVVGVAAGAAVTAVAVAWRQLPQRLLHYPGGLLLKPQNTHTPIPGGNKSRYLSRPAPKPRPI